MKNDDECIHGLGPISACTICNGREKRDEIRRNQVVMRFPAQFGSRLECGHEPEIGDLIARMGDGRLVCTEVHAMNPRPIIEMDLRYWADYKPRVVTFAADDPETAPCPAIVTDVPDQYGVVGRTVVRVPWALSEIELTHLAKGGTLWLSTWGGLPPHMLEVQGP